MFLFQATYDVGNNHVRVDLNMSKHESKGMLCSWISVVAPSVNAGYRPDLDSEADVMFIACPFSF